MRYYARKVKNNILNKENYATKLKSDSGEKVEMVKGYAEKNTGVSAQ